MFIIVQRLQVIWMFSFQRNFSFGAVCAADEKHLSANTDVVAIVKYLITNVGKTSSCVAVCV